MIVDRQLAICAIVSVAGHFAFARGLDYLPPHHDTAPPNLVQVHVIEPPIPEPPPEPVKPEEPKPEQPKLAEAPKVEPPRNRRFAALQASPSVMQCERRSVAQRGCRRANPVQPSARSPRTMDSVASAA